MYIYKQCTTGWVLPSCSNTLTCIVDENVKSGLRLQEVFSKAAYRLQTSQIQQHKHHLIVPTLLMDINIVLIRL